MHTHYPTLMRRQALRLYKAGLAPAAVAAQLTKIVSANPMLDWPIIDRKMVQNWAKRQKWDSQVVPEYRDDTANVHLVFTYGTLKRGLWNNRILQSGRATFVGTGFTARTFVMFDGGFPYVADPADLEPGAAWRLAAGNVWGEVWLVNDATMADMDRLEGVPHHYRRDSEIIMLNNTEAFYGKIVRGFKAIKASIYIQQQPSIRERTMVSPGRGEFPLLVWPVHKSQAA